MERRFTCRSVIRERARARARDALIFKPGMIPSARDVRTDAFNFAAHRCARRAKERRRIRASGARRLAEHIDRSFMRFHGGLPCDVPRNGRPSSLPFSHCPLSLFVFLWVRDLHLFSYSKKLACSHGRSRLLATRQSHRS